MAEPNRKKTKNKEDGLISENTYLLKEEDYKLHLAPDLTNLSLDELVLQYIDIDRQSKLLKGRVLLVMRNHFDSDKEFGQWVATHRLCVGNQQARNRLMHLAKFFSGGRDMEGICLTAAYEISAPVNSEKSKAVYNQAHGENLSVKEVKALFNDGEEKSPKKDDLKQEQEKESSSAEYKEKIQQVATDLIDNVMQGQSDKFKLEVLEKAIQFLKKRV